MLRIRKAQIDAITHGRLLEFVEQTAREVWRDFGTELRNAGHRQENIYSVVESWIMRARDRGFRTREQMRVYVDACIILDPQELESPRDPALEDLLSDSMLHAARKSELLAEYLAFVSLQQSYRKEVP